MITFNCPHCGQLLQTDDRAVGAVVACINCQNQMTVPAPQFVATSAAPPRLRLSLARQRTIRRARGPGIICPNPRCGYAGPSREVSKGSVLLLIILLMLAVVPGLLYAGLVSGVIRYCPVCGMQVATT